MATVLVLDGHSFSALTIVRSLGRLGHRVLVASTLPQAIAGRSRYAYEHLVAACSPEYARTYVDWINQIYHSHAIDHLFWTTTASALALDRFRHRLSPSLLTDLPPTGVMSRAYDKLMTIEIARQLNIPVPQTWICDSGEELAGLLSKIPQDCIIKPKNSAAFVGDEIVNCGRHRYVRSRPALCDAYTSLAAQHPRPIIQEFIAGYGFGIFLLMQDGEPVGAFAHRRIREADPLGSGGCFRISTALPEDAYVYAVSLLRALKWRGGAMVEFKRDAKDGTAKLIEINGRFWLSLALCNIAGMDFPALLLRMKQGEKLPSTQSNYKVGVGSHWLGGEVMHLYKVMKGKPAEYPGEFPGRCTTLIQMMVDCLRYPRFDTFNFDDMRPAWCELRMLFRGQV